MAVLALMICICIPFIPQFLYWKYISGHWVIWSYVDESFKYWREPKLIRVLFDACNGWILYSPIVVFPLLFLIKGRHTNKSFERAYLYIFAIATYLFASWWAWWFGGAFGHRSYVEFLALLALPFAGFVHMVGQYKFLRVVFGLLCLILCYYNIGLTYEYSAPWDGENWTYLALWEKIKKIFFLV